MKTTTKLFAATALIVGMALTNSANANLIINGGFEAPVIPAQSYNTYTTIPGWTTSSGPGIEIQNNIAGAPFEGRQFVELDSKANSSMYQNVATQSKQWYVLTFEYSARPTQPSETTGITLAINGGAAYTYDLAGLVNTAWHKETVFFEGTGLDKIAFAAIGNSDTLGGYIDDVQLEAATVPVPEPSTIIAGALLLLPFGAGAFRSIRKNRTK